MEPVLIGIGYRKRSGKDTVADRLVANYGFKKMSWADLLKKGVNAWHGWDDRHGYGELKEVVDEYWGYSPRVAYQKIGTDLMRMQWRDTFWVDCAMRQIQTWMAEGHSVVVPDTRFPNEAAAVLKAGGLLWRVDRPGLPEPNPPPQNRFLAWFNQRVLGKKYDHFSEVGLYYYDEWTEVIDNDGSLDELYAKVDGLMPLPD